MTTAGAAPVANVSPAAFSYAAALAPMMWAFVAIALVELLVVHLVVALSAGPWPAAILSLLSMAGIAWLVALIRSFRRLPVLVGSEGIVLHAGTLRRIDVPRDAIERVDDRIAELDLRAKGVLRMSLLAYPNVAIHLRHPVQGRGGRTIHLIVHRLDDPVTFLRATD